MGAGVRHGMFTAVKLIASPLGKIHGYAPKKSWPLVNATPSAPRSGRSAILYFPISAVSYAIAVIDFGALQPVSAHAVGLYE